MSGCTWELALKAVYIHLNGSSPGRESLQPDSQARLCLSGAASEAVQQPVCCLISLVCQIDTSWSTLPCGIEADHSSWYAFKRRTDLRGES